MKEIVAVLKSLETALLFYSAAICLMLVATGISTPANAQAGEDLQATAAAAIQAPDWPRAADLYSELTRIEPENAVAWYRLGLATFRSGGHKPTARQAFEKAIELGFPPAPALLGIARSFASDADNEAAFKNLERLAELGPSSFALSQLTSDDDFAALSSDARFKQLIVRLTPCATEEYRQFDFWLGAWNVVSPQAQPLGTNTITESLDGCMLIENWESASGGQKGMSINYYDNQEKIWTQIFRDNSGNIANWPTITGGFTDGSMVLESAEDAQPRTRWIWTRQDDGRVRQMAESSSDGGDTWTVVWDSYYELMNH